MADDSPILVTAPAGPTMAKRGHVAYPDWQVTLDGKDLSDTLRPYLMQLSIKERRGEMADQVQIMLDDSKGDLELPPYGALLSISIGWKGGGDQEAGLIEKGDFTVDEIGHAGPPDVITLRARSADLTSAWRKRHDQSWLDKKLADILNEIAGRQGVETRIAESLGEKQIKLVTQNRESDMALLARLGKEHDAVATVKRGTLIFLPMAGGRTASGATLEPVTIDRADGDRHSFTIEAREEYTGVTAKWHDKKSAKQKKSAAKSKRKDGSALNRAKGKREKPSATAGTGDDPKVLPKIYPSEAEAQRAAEAEWARIQRAPRKLRLSLALGRPEIGAEQPIVATGFRPEIDDLDWIVSDVSHQLGNNGLVSRVSCEIAG